MVVTLSQPNAGWQTESFRPAEPAAFAGVGQKLDLLRQRLTAARKLDRIVGVAFGH